MLQLPPLLSPNTPPGQISNQLCRWATLMNREYHKWYSPRLGRDMELLLYGWGGRPVIAFPTSFGRFYQNEDFSLIHSVSDRLENGHLQIVCVDAVDTESWYNRSIPTHERARRHNQDRKSVV